MYCNSVSILQKFRLRKCIAAGLEKVCCNTNIVLQARRLVGLGVVLQYNGLYCRGKGWTVSQYSSRYCDRRPRQKAGLCCNTTQLAQDTALLCVQ